MKKNLLILVVFVLSASGCLRSVHKLYTENDLVYEPALEGQWEEGEGKSLWTFTRDGQKRYELLYRQRVTDQNVPGRGDFTVPAKFEAHLVRLGKHLFLDLFPKDVVSRNDLFAVHVIPAHTFSRVELSKSTLRLAMLDHEWFKRMIDEGRLAVMYEEIEKGQYVLTAKTPDIQKLVVTYAEDPDAFSDPTELTRTK